MIYLYMMARVFYLLFFLISFIKCGLAQLPMDRERYLDSLNTIVKQSPSDSVKARANYYLVYYWLSTDTLKARQCLEEGKRLSKKSAFMTALSYGHEGYFYYASDIDKSESLYLKSDKLLSRFATLEAYRARSNIWSACAAIRQRKDDDKGYIDIILSKAIPLALKAKDTAIVGHQYAGLGVAFMNTEQYEKAEVYLDKAIQTLKSLPTQPSRLISVYNRMGENYMLLKKYSAAKATLDTVKAMLAPYPQSELYAGHYLVEGMYRHNLKQYHQAVLSFDKGIKLANGPNKDYIIQELQLYKVKSLIADQTYEQARVLLEKLSKDEALMEQNNSRLEVYSGLAESYAGLGKMNLAYNWQKRFAKLSDSIAHSQLSKDVNALEIKYRNAEKQKEINVLKAKNMQAALEAKNQSLVNWLLSSVSIFLLIVAVFSLLYYSSNKKLLAQKELSHQQHLNDLAQQQQLQFSQAMLQGEERERRRLARDLHDGLGGMLAGMKINLSGQLEDPDTDNHKKNLRKVIGELDSSVTELRRIAHNMMPVNLLHFGLKTALEDLCGKLMTNTTRIDFQAFEIDDHIPEQIQINIYRIVQETLANAIRHANATSIILQCSQNGNTFFITQEDNGKGFELNAIAAGKGIGLSNIRNRVGFLKGQMEIQSVINEGTIINIEVKVD